MKTNLLLISLLGFIMGCGSHSDHQDYFISAPPVEITDPVHQQDIINFEAADEDAEQEEKHLELMEALKKKMDQTEELDFQTLEIVPEDPKIKPEETVVVVVPEPTPTPIKPTVPKLQPVPQPQPEVVKPQPEVKPIPPQSEVKTPAPVAVKKDLRIGKEGRGSVYYLPVLDDERNCAANKQVHMRDPQGKILAKLCRNEILNCALQGSCYFLKPQEIVLFAYSGHVKVKIPNSNRVVQEPRFKLNHDMKECPYGMGAAKTCLDPYRSIAADKRFHKRGDVVYIPLLDGQVLPNGETHDGHMVVRDTGGAILGEGRFDFFIGFDDYKDHLFTRLNLADKNKRSFTYYRIPDDEASMIRKARAFPSVPNAAKLTTLAVLEVQKKLGLAQSETASE